MNKIEVKSTGTLVDEWITAGLKLKHFPENEQIQDRLHELGNVVTIRFLSKKVENPDLDQAAIWTQVEKLTDVSNRCWMAQEIVHQYQQYDNLKDDELAVIADAAFSAQRTNADRNKLIRYIDELMGESNTQLIKTYS